MIKCTSVFFMLVFSSIIVAQVNYVQINNLTGISFQQQEIDLVKQKVDSITNIWPSSLTNKIVLYSYTNYLLDNKKKDFEFWNNITQDLGRYYMIMGLEFNDKNEFSFRIKLSLPYEDYFICNTNSNYIILEKQLENIGNKELKSVKDFVKAQKVVVEALLKNIKTYKDCCIGLRYDEFCIPCPTEDTIKESLRDLGFTAIPIKYVSDNPPALRDSNSTGIRQTNTILGEQNIKIIIDGQEIFVKDYMNLQLLRLENYNLTNTGFITKNQNLCKNSTIFDEINTEFSSSSSSVKIWWHIWDDPQSDSDLLFEKVEGAEGLGDKIYDELLALISQYCVTLTSGTQICKGTNRFINPCTVLTKGDYDGEGPSAIAIGTLAHAIIQSYYKTFFATNKVYLEYAIPGASSGTLGNIGYADIVNETTRELWEIKSVAGAVIYGKPEVDIYVQQYNNNCLIEVPAAGIKPPIRHGTNFQEFSYPFPGNKTLTAYYHENQAGTKYPGVISYKIESNSKRIPRLVPILVPESDLSRFRKLIEAMMKSPNPQITVLNYFNINPDDVVKFTIIAGVVAAGSTYITGQSGGTSSAVTVPLMISAGIIFTAGLKYSF